MIHSILKTVAIASAFLALAIVFLASFALIIKFTL